MVPKERRQNEFFHSDFMKGYAFSVKAEHPESFLLLLISDKHHQHRLLGRTSCSDSSL